MRAPEDLDPNTSRRSQAGKNKNWESLEEIWSVEFDMVSIALVLLLLPPPSCKTGMEHG